MNSNQHTTPITVIPVRPVFTPTHPALNGDESASAPVIHQAHTAGRRTFGRKLPRQTFGRMSG